MDKSITADQLRACRKALYGKMESYLRAEKLLLPDGRVRCLRCGGSAGLCGENWLCECGAAGELMDTAAMLYPELDDFARLERIYAVLHMKFPYLRTVEAEELLEMEFPGKPALVEDLLGQGVYLLAGAAKIGKSWLALDLADRVSRGEYFWGRRTEQGSVLYLSLEDTYQRLQGRLSRVSDSEPGALIFATDCARAGEGLEEQLRSQCEARPDLRLIIVDTLQKVRRTSTENYSYSADYEVMSAFKRLADEMGITVLVVHHTRKEESSDAMNMVSGTMGLNGAADGTLVLFKPVRSGTTAFLQVTGRDLPDQRLRLEMDKASMRWTCLGPAEDGEGETELEPVLLRAAQLIREEGPFEGTATELLARLAPEGRLSPSALSRKLKVNAAALEDRLGLCVRFSRDQNTRRLSLRQVS